LVDIKEDGWGYIAENIPVKYAPLLAAAPALARAMMNAVARLRQIVGEDLLRSHPHETEKELRRTLRNLRDALRKAETEQKGDV